MKKSLKGIITSGLTALLFGTLSVGTTFAMFANETTTTIQIASGSVSISNDMTITAIGSLNAGDTNTIGSENKYGHFNNGGEAWVQDDGYIVVSRLTPGDNMTLNTEPTNNSDVSIKARLKVIMNGDLSPALKVVVNDAIKGTNENYDMEMAGNATLVTPWISIAEQATIAGFSVDISYPVTGDLTLPSNIGPNSKYQNKYANIAVTWEAVQGNATTDDRALVTIDKDSLNLVDGETIVYASDGTTTRKVHRDQICYNPYNPKHVNLRYVEDANGLVVDANGFLTLRDDASTCDFKGSIVDGGEVIFLPTGTIDQDAVNGGIGATSVSNDHLAFNKSFTLVGASEYRDGKVTNMTTIDTKGYRHGAGTYFNQFAFSGTALNPINVTMNNVNIQSSSFNEASETIGQNVYSKGMLYFHNANATFNHCYFDGSNFEYNAVSRAIFDLRDGANVTLNDCEALTYSNGENVANVGICEQVLVNASTASSADAGLTHFAMNGGKVRYYDAAQSTVYTLPNSQTISLADFPANKGVIVGFYLSNAAQDLDMNSSFVFTDVNFNGHITTNASREVSCVTAYAGYANLLNFVNNL